MALVRSPVARIRRNAGFRTALAAAIKLGCSRIYLLEIEAGRSSPGEKLFEKMAKLYGVTDRALTLALNAARRDLLKRQLESLGA